MEKTSKERNDKPYFVSLIVRTRNEEEYIGGFLDSLVKQTYPKDKFEVLVIDGMSEDRTLDIVEGYKDRLDLRVFKNRKIRSPHALNIGITKARGDFFMNLIAHSSLPRDYVEKTVKKFLEIEKKEPDLVCVGGALVGRYTTTFSKLVGLVYSTPFSGARSMVLWRKEKSLIPIGPNFGLFDKKIVTDVGNFDEDFFVGEDRDLFIRLKQAGYRFFIDPEVKIFYYTRDSFKKFLRQTYNYGAGLGFITRKKRYFDFMWFVPPLFLFYEILTALSIFLGSAFIFPLILIPLILYLGIATFFSTQLFFNTKSTLCVVLPIMYLIFHNILGIGILSGLILMKKAYWLN